MAHQMAIVSVYTMLIQNKGIKEILKDLKRQGIDHIGRVAVVQEALKWQEYLGIHKK
ncbi:MAG: hypothetical protein PHY56_00130 [Candidatus Omnitrophica bacterium]|nr:hypothetical protein [Candidatus Omnitrophota bacterium]